MENNFSLFTQYIKKLHDSVFPLMWFMNVILPLKDPTESIIFWRPRWHFFIRMFHSHIEIYDQVHFLTLDVNIWESYEMGFFRKGATHVLLTDFTRIGFLGLLERIRTSFGYFLLIFFCAFYGGNVICWEFLMGNYWKLGTENS